MFDEAPAVADGQGRGIVKIVLTRGSGGRGYQPPSPVRTRRIVVRRDWPTGLEEDDLIPALAWVCQQRLESNRQLAVVNHQNQLEQLLASAEWPGSHPSEGPMQDFDGMLIEDVLGLRIVAQIDPCGQSLRLRRSGLVAELAGPLRCANVMP